MRTLRWAVGSFARLLADVLLLSAGLAVALWVATYSGPLHVRHNESSGRDGAWDVQAHMIGARGGLWVLRLSTRVGDAVPPSGLFGPTPWSVPARSLYDPDTHLTPAQTGPRRLGFSSQFRRAERSQLMVDARTGRRSDVVVTEEERITRVPLAAIVAGLLIVPAVRIAIAARRRWRRRSPDDDDDEEARPIFPVAARVFALTALTSALLLALAAAEWAGSHRGELNLSVVARPASSWSPYDGWQTRRSVASTERGWEFVKLRTEGIRTANSPSDQAMMYLIGTNLRGGFPDRGLPPGYAAVGGSSGGFRLLGFGYAWELTPYGPMSRTRLIVPSTQGAPTLTTVPVPPTAPIGRHLTWSVVIPRWAMALGFAILPGIWLLRFRHPLRALRRRRRGLCPDCGYDVRATPGRCPECGWAVPDPCGA